jgi:hypothetical protein
VAVEYIKPMKSHIPFPKTCIEDYINYRKEIASEINTISIKHKLSENKAGKYAELSNIIDKIYSNYKHLIHMQDIYIFDGLMNLENFLRNDLELKKYKIREIISHEKKHAKKIYELGYYISTFSCILLKTRKGKLTYAVQTHIHSDDIIPSKDLKEMALAPDNPSITDRLY